MTLDRYLSEAETTNAEFAAKVGVDQTTISRLRRGLIDPSLSLMRRIADETGSMVTPNDFWNGGRRLAPSAPSSTEASVA